MTMDRFTSDFDRIFADFQGFSRMIGAPTEDARAQNEVESGANAAANSPALCTEASPTRTGNTTEIQND